MSFSSREQGEKFWGSCVLWWILGETELGSEEEADPIARVTALLEPETSSKSFQA